MNKFVMFILCLFVLPACGTGGGTLSLQVSQTAAVNPTPTPGPGGTSSGKALFSQWNEVSGMYNIDLSHQQFGVSSAVTVNTIAGNCTCQALFQGTQSSGTIAFSGCAGTYANCSSFNSGAGTYTKSSTDLQICLSASNCSNLR